MCSIIERSLPYCYTTSSYCATTAGKSVYRVPLDACEAFTTLPSHYFPLWTWTVASTENPGLEIRVLTLAQHMESEAAGVLLSGSPKFEINANDIVNI